MQDADESPPSSPESISARSTEHPTSNHGEGERSSMHTPSGEIPVDPDMLVDDPGDEEVSEGEDLFNDNFMR